VQLTGVLNCVKEAEKKVQELKEREAQEIERKKKEKEERMKTKFVVNYPVSSFASAVQEGWRNFVNNSVFRFAMRDDRC
jgi:hypothetical protein